MPYRGIFEQHTQNSVYEMEIASWYNTLYAFRVFLCQQ
jgi:hypothetical protein